LGRDARTHARSRAEQRNGASSQASRQHQVAQPQRQNLASTRAAPSSACKVADPARAAAVSGLSWPCAISRSPPASASRSRSRGSSSRSAPCASLVRQTRPKARPKQPPTGDACARRGWWRVRAGVGRKECSASRQRGRILAMARPDGAGVAARRRAAGRGAPANGDRREDLIQPKQGGAGEGTPRQILASSDGWLFRRRAQDGKRLFHTAVVGRNRGAARGATAPRRGGRARPHGSAGGSFVVEWLGGANRTMF